MKIMRVNKEIGDMKCNNINRNIRELKSVFKNNEIKAS